MSWSQTPLGEVIRLKRGHDLPASQRVIGEIPVISSSGITGYHNAAKAEGPGVVTGRYGTLGVVHYIEGPYWPLNTALYVEDFKGNYPRFVGYLLTTLELGAKNEAGAVPGVNRNTLHQMSVSVPDVDTQVSIATVLLQYDDLIETNRRRIALLEEAARLLYREWFVNLRFPGYAAVRKMALPDGWRTRSLSEVVEVNRESLSSKSQPSEIQYVDIASVETGIVLGATRMPFAEAPGRARRLVQHGDVIWSCVRPNRRSYSLMWKPDDDLVVSTGFAVLSAKSVPFSYLYFATTSDDFVAYLTNRATGAAYPAVTAKDFEEAPLLCPKLEVLQDFHERCLPMLELLNTLIKQNEQLTIARDALLPKLISGAIQV